MRKDLVRQFDCFLAELPSVRLNDVRIADDLVNTHDRMLTGGFYAEVDLAYDSSIAEERSGRPFGIESLYNAVGLLTNDYDGFIDVGETSVRCRPVAKFLLLDG